MQCPVDHVDMIVVEHDNIEMDYCTECGGVWFDAGEIELLFESLKNRESESAAQALLTPNRADSAEQKRKCPICARKMDKATICAEPQVLIDACPRGDGLWFDGGELSQAVSQLTGLQCGKTDADSVLSFLGETFKANKGSTGEQT